MSDDEVMTLETALNSINNTLDEAWEGFANAYVVEADQSAWAEIERLARLGAAVEAMPTLTTLAHLSGYTTPQWKLWDESGESSEVTGEGSTAAECFKLT